MNLEEMLGIDFTRPEDQQARALVAADSRMLDELIALRENQGLSQTAVAARMGVSPSAVSRIESGERDPHLSTLRRYAMAVGAVIQHSVNRFEQASVDAVWSAGEGAGLDEAWSEQGNALGQIIQKMPRQDA